MGPLVGGSGEGDRINTAAEAARCKELNELGNLYLAQFAKLREGFQQKTILLYKNYLNDWSYWSYIASIDDHGYKTVFYHLVTTMLLTLKEISITELIYPCTSTEKPKDSAEELAIEEPKCEIPGKIEFDLGAVKLELSCESYKLEAGKGRWKT